MNQSSIERRRHQRVQCSLPVKARRIEASVAAPLSDSPPEFVTKAVNVSQGGLYIEASQPLSESELYRLSIDLPGSDARVTAFAEVVWSDDRGGGIHFLAVHEEQENYLKDFLCSCSGSCP